MYDCYCCKYLGINAQIQKTVCADSGKHEFIGQARGALLCTFRCILQRASLRRRSFPCVRGGGVVNPSVSLTADSSLSMPFAKNPTYDRNHRADSCFMNLRSRSCGDFFMCKNTHVPKWHFHSLPESLHLRARSARACCCRTTRPAPYRDTSSAPRNMPRSAASGRCGRGARRSRCARGSTAPT